MPYGQSAKPSTRPNGLPCDYGTPENFPRHRHAMIARNSTQTETSRWCGCSHRFPSDFLSHFLRLPAYIRPGITQTLTLCQRSLANPQQFPGSHHPTPERFRGRKTVRNTLASSWPVVPLRKHAATAASTCSFVTVVRPRALRPSINVEWSALTFFLRGLCGRQSLVENYILAVHADPCFPSSQIVLDHRRRP